MLVNLNVYDPTKPLEPSLSLGERVKYFSQFDNTPYTPQSPDIPHVSFGEAISKNVSQISDQIKYAADKEAAIQTNEEEALSGLSPALMPEEPKPFEPVVPTALQNFYRGAKNIAVENNEIAAFMDYERASNNRLDPEFIRSGGSWPLIKDTKYAQYLSEFDDVINQQQFLAKLNNIDSREQRRHALGEMSPWVTFPGAMAAGLISPTTALPGGALIRTARGGVAIGRSAATVAGYGALGGALQEELLGFSQDDHTFTETLVGAAVGGTIGALLGSVSYKALSVRERQTAAAFMGKILANKDAPETMMFNVMPERTDPALVKGAQEVFDYVHGALVRGGMADDQSVQNAVLFSIKMAHLSQIDGKRSPLEIMQQYEARIEFEKSPIEEALRGTDQDGRILAQQGDGTAAGAGGTVAPETTGRAPTAPIAVGRLIDQPETPRPVGGGQAYVPTVNEKIAKVASEVANKAAPITERVVPKAYSQVSEELARRIAQAFDRMEHAPYDIKVAKAYEDFAKETRSQFDALQKTGLKIELVPQGRPDPYAASPDLALKDIQDNNHLWVVLPEQPTRLRSGNRHPMMVDTDVTIDGRTLTTRELFDIVHDVFGYAQHGFDRTPSGHENAWRVHAAMYSDNARRAMTTETRGQNSWVNYGPFAERNRTASALDTVYAEQKVGLLPDWAVNDGRLDDPRILNQEAVRKQTDTPEFKRWFGDSKVVDENGRPLVVYHGTTADEAFDTFSVDGSVVKEDDQYFRSGSGSDPTTFLGAHFAKEWSVANKFAKGLYGERVGADTGNRVYPTFLKIERPYHTTNNKMIDEMLDGNYRDPSIEDVLDYDETLFERYDNDKAFRRTTNERALNEGNGASGDPDYGLAQEMADVYRAKLREKGYDGIVYENEIEGGTSYVVFDPTQIKSATGNRGTFDPNDPKILNQSPVFYSAVERGIEASPSAKATAERWVSLFGKMNEVKKDELDWLGIMDWLKGRKGQQITKQELLDFVNANKVEIVEVTKGGFSRENMLAKYGLTEDEYNNLPQEEAARIYSEFRRASGVDANGSPKFGPGGNLVVPGGENYRELLLMLPPAIESPRYKALKSEADALVGKRDPASEARRNEIYAEYDRMAAKQFRGPHWDEPNVLAHVRFSERMVDGKRTLFIEEFQSDWHQKGRKFGYADKNSAARAKLLDDKLKELRKELAGTIERINSENNLPSTIEVIRSTLDPNERNKIYKKRKELYANSADYVRLSKEVEDAQEELRIASKAALAPPDAPLKNTSEWTALLMKRMIRYAADNGFEKVAWTTGARQADRYDLSKQIKAVHFEKNGSSGFTPRDAIDEDSVGTLTALDHNGSEVFRRVVDANDLPEHVGKDVAEKLLSQDGEYSTRGGIAKVSRKLEGLDLKVGGEGMVSYYDDIMVKVTNSLVKKYGARVNDGRMTTTTKDYSLAVEKRGQNRYDVVDSRGDDYDGTATFSTREEAEEYVKTLMKDVPDEPIHVFDVTPELRNIAQEKGFPLFQRDGQGDVRGQLHIYDDEAVIKMFKNFDASTFQHEAMHYYVELLFKIGSAPDASDALKAELKALLDLAGVDHPSKFTTEHHEKIASNWERYLAEGKAPTKELEGVFSNFKKWLLDVYHALTNIQGGEVSPEVKKFFDNMLTIEGSRPLAIDPEAVPRSAGAAALGGVELADMQIKGAAARAAARAFKAMVPGTKIMFARVPYAREVGLHLFEFSNYIQGNEGGRMSTPQAAESFLGRWNAGLSDAEQATGIAWKAFKDTDTYRNNPMTREQFYEEVGKAMRRDDKHPIKEVAEVARAWREKVFEPLKRRGIEVGLFPADIKPEYAISYFSRLWDHDKLIANEPAARKLLAAHILNKLNAEWDADTVRYNRTKERLAQRLDDLNLSAEQRIKTLESLDNDIASLEELYPQHVSAMEQIAEIDSKLRQARKDGDKPEVEKLSALKETIVKGGGKELAEFRKNMRDLSGRRTTVDRGYQGLVERSDRVLAQMADLEHANFRAMERLIRRGQKLEKELDKLDADALHETIQELADKYSELARKAERAAERADKEITNIQKRTASSTSKDETVAARASTEAKFGPPEEAAAKKAEASEAAQRNQERRAAADEKIAKRLREEVQRQQALAESMEETATRLREARELDHEAVLDEIKASVTKLERETSASTLRRGERMTALGERLAKLDPKQVDERGRALMRMQAAAEKRFLDKWEKAALDADPNAPTRPNLADMADEIAGDVFNKMVGRQGPRAAQDLIKITARGPLKERTFDIHDLFSIDAGGGQRVSVEDFLNNNISEVGTQYTKSMSRQTEMYGKFGSLDMAEQIGKIDEQYQALAAKATSPEERIAIDKEREEIKKTIEALRDVFLGRYALDQATGKFATLVHYTNAFNYLRAMGGALASNLGEIIRPAMVHGLSVYMQTAFGALGNAKLLGAVLNDVKGSGAFADKYTLARVAQIGDLMEPMHRQSAALAFVDNMTRVASTWNGLRIWTNFVQGFSAALAQNRLYRVIMDFDNAPAKERELLAHLGIADEASRERLKRYMTAHAETDGNIVSVNVDKWGDTADAELARAQYYAAMNKDVNSVIVRRGIADIPLMGNTPMGKLLLQFNTFNIAAHSRVLVRGLQEGPQRFIGGMIALTTMGMMITYLKAALNNRLDKLPDFQANPGWWIAEGIDNSGVVSLFTTVSNGLEKIAGVNPLKDPMRLWGETGQGSEKNANRSMIGPLLGPTPGALENFGTAAFGLKNFIKGEEVTSAQQNAAWRSLIFNTYPGINQGIKYWLNPPD